MFTHFIISFAILFGSVICKDQSTYEYCAIWGDPRLLPFVLSNEQLRTVTPCGLPTKPELFFRNKHAEIRVVNTGTIYGNIIKFLIVLFEESTSDDDVCTFDESYFQSFRSGLKCGSAEISINQTMVIEHKNADLIIHVHNQNTHYEVGLWTSFENANKSRGLCVKGCPVPISISSRAALPRIHSQDQIVSSMAEQICDIYLQEFIGLSNQVPANMKQLVESTRQGCITDVSVYGDKKYAEEAVISIVSALMTMNAKTLEQIKQATIHVSNISQRIIKSADQVAGEVIAKKKAFGGLRR